MCLQLGANNTAVDPKCGSGPFPAPSSRRCIDPKIQDLIDDCPSFDLGFWWKWKVQPYFVLHNLYSYKPVRRWILWTVRSGSNGSLVLVLRYPCPVGYYFYFVATQGHYTKTKWHRDTKLKKNKNNMGPLATHLAHSLTQLVLVYSSLSKISLLYF